MPNQFVHEITSEALNHFNQIDTRGTDSLNLLDIMNYQKHGPEQKRVGQFLLDNFESIHNIFNDNLNQPITKEELSYLNDLSSSNPAVVNDRINKDKMRVGSGAAIEALAAAGIPSVIAVGVSSLGTGPLGPLWVIGMDAVGGVGGYIWGADHAEKTDRQNMAKLDKLAP